MNSFKKSVFAILKFIPLAACILCALLFVFEGRDITAEALTQRVPSDSVGAVIFFLLSYCFKALTVFFPVVLLIAAVGYVFPLPAALIISLVGLLCEFSVGYFVGRVSGAGMAERFAEKHPKLAQKAESAPASEFFRVFFLRVIACLPGDAVGMMLGAQKIPFGKYLAASMLGTLPTLLSVTVMGATVTDPTSPAFIISTLFTAIVSVISAVIYLVWAKNSDREVKNTKRRRFGERWWRVLLRQRFLVIVCLLLQLAFIIFILAESSKVSVVISYIMAVVSFAVALVIVSDQDVGAYKLLWVFLILCFPIFGGLLYLFFTRQRDSKSFSQAVKNAAEKGNLALASEDDAFEEAVMQNPERAPLLRYLKNTAGFPVYRDSNAVYLSPGEEKFKVLTEELRKAEKFIFLEYFIIEEGVMWEEILGILKEKAQAGVTVKVLYDDLGCFLLLPKNYPKVLEKFGIECRVFSPFLPMLTAKQNNRDHRKIAVIDGKVAFTGGINLADEYINEYEKHGHWKDASVMIEGPAAKSFTAFFLEMWEISKGTVEDYARFLSKETFLDADSFVVPYADSPTDRENVSAQVYLSLANGAKDYLYINTPYLILDEVMLDSICRAAKSGVDVRIVTPHKWDKWFVHMTTRSYYRELIDAGVKIYEYTPGFIHSKVFVSDDRVANVGTANLDFRSLYLHFECGALFLGGRVIDEVKQDFLRTLDSCTEITREDTKCGVFMKLFQNIMRLFSPLM